MGMIDVAGFGAHYPANMEPSRWAGLAPAQSPEHSLPVIAATTGETAIRASHLLINPIVPVDNGYPGYSAYGCINGQ